MLEIPVYVKEFRYKVATEHMLRCNAVWHCKSLNVSFPDTIKMRFLIDPFHIHAEAHSGATGIRKGGGQNT